MPIIDVPTVEGRVWSFAPEEAENLQYWMDALQKAAAPFILQRATASSSAAVIVNCNTIDSSSS